MAQQGQQQDPATAIGASRSHESTTKAQVEMTKAQMDDARKHEEMAMKDDLRRDKMAQDLYVDAAKTLGQYGSAVDIDRIKAEQEKERQTMK